VPLSHLSGTAIPHPPLHSAQAERRERNRIRARERQLLYPPDPEDPRKRIPRESPRALFPTLPMPHKSLRTCVENPLKAPNEYLYLVQYTDAPTATYAFHTPDTERWRNKTFPSIFQACVAAAQAGYLDASW
jgi:hypothetical protein